MFVHQLKANGRVLEFNVSVFPDRIKAYAYLSAKRAENKKGEHHPPFCVSLALFRDELGSASRSITAQGDIVPLSAVEVWENENLNAQNVAEFIVDGLARPKAEEDGDRPFNRAELKRVITSFYSRYEMQVYHIAHSTVSFKPTKLPLSVDCAMEAAKCNRNISASPASRRSITAVANDFLKSELIVLGYD